jgi:hypothetical protein
MRKPDYGKRRRKVWPRAVLAAASVILLAAPAEAGPATWARNFRTAGRLPLPYENYAIRSVAIHPRGILAVGSASNAGPTVMLLSDDGRLLRHRSYNRLDIRRPGCFRVTSDNGAVIAGSNSTTLNPIVTRLAPDGGVMWRREYLLPPADKASDHQPVVSVVQTADGGFVVTAESGKGYDILVMRLDADGRIVWSKSYGTGGSEVVYAVRETSDGGLVLAGVQTPVYDGKGQLLVIRLESTGGIVWQKAFGGDGYFHAYGTAVATTRDGGFVISGGTLPVGVANWPALVVKLNGDGAIEWQKSYLTVKRASAGSVSQTADGGYVATVMCDDPLPRGTGFGGVMRLTADGSIAWVTGGPYFTDAAETSDGGCLVSGYSNVPSGRSTRGLLFRLDLNGQAESCGLLRPLTFETREAGLLEGAASLVPRDTAVKSRLLRPVVRPGTVASRRLCPEAAGACR